MNVEDDGPLFFGIGAVDVQKVRAFLGVAVGNIAKDARIVTLGRGVGQCVERSAERVDAVVK